MRTRTTALAFVLLAASAAAQSTDPSRPSPWPAAGLEGAGDGASRTYYFALEAGPGAVLIDVETRARVFSCAVTVDLEAALGVPVGRGGAIAGTDAPARERTRVAVAERMRLFARVQIDANTAYYRIRLETPRRWDSYGVNGAGGDATQVHEYALDAGPGEIEIHVQAVARTVQTAVVVEVLDDAGNSVTVGGAKAGTSPVRESWRASLPERRALRLRITVEPDAGDWSVWIDGEVHR